MPATSQLSTAAPLRASALNRWLPVFLFAILWADLVRQLSYTWDTNEQYAYGWFVPFLALALFWRRWATRPSPLRLSRGESAGTLAHCQGEGLGVKDSGESSPGFPRGLFARGLVCLLAFCLLPLRVVHEINQDWPLISWPLATVVVALSLYAVFMQGGWRLLTHFAFPICFILVAVRWPYRIEHGLTQNLMQVVASLTVEILGWFNIPALQRGNLIELSTGVLGVDEACSGIRSFQSTLMAALFLGELYLLRWPIRLVLVGAGLTTAFLLNLCRTLLLTWQANAHGLSAIDKWHDPAGLTIAVACFAILWLLAVLIKHKYSPSTRLTPGPSNPQPSTFNPQLPSALRTYLLAIGLWSLLCLVATEVWYRGHELRRADTAQWWVSYPTNLPSFQPVNVSKAAAKLLRHDMESGGSWDDPDGTKWSVFCFRWKEGDPAARMSAQGHRPEYCLVGSGHNLIAMSGTQYLPAKGIALPFRLYTFDRAERPMHVFFCLWEDGAETQAGYGKTKTGDRLRTAWAGRRGMGQQTLEIICTGYPDMAAAEKAARERLPGLIRVENHKTEPIAGGSR